MRRLIVYGTGGLGNRLRPMASAKVLAKQYDRELLVYWNKEPSCTVPFQDLFNATEWNVINRNEFKALGYDHKWSPLMPVIKKIQTDMAIKYGWDNGQRQLLSTDVENVLYLSNNFDEKVKKDSISWLKRFRPNYSVQVVINELVKSLNLSKEVVGIHARGTDMTGTSYEWYAKQARKWNQTNRLFLCTESEKYKQQFQAEFPDILIQPNVVHARKQAASREWKRNLNVPEEAMIYSVIDLFLLAHTSIQVAWPASSFASIARIIGENYG